MNARVVVVLTICIIASSTAVAAQSAASTGANDTITFTVPLNLTRLLPEITRVRVSCTVQSMAITTDRRVVKGVTFPGYVSNQQEVSVSNGQIVTFATIVVSVAGVLENPAGKAATYFCQLSGYSDSLQRWELFNHCSSNGTLECTLMPFRLSSDNSVANHGTTNTGTFTW